MVNNMYYNIEIKIEPEILNNKPMYFWCIVEYRVGGTGVNSGHGWSVSVEQCAIDAFAYYQRNIKDCI